MSALSVGWYNPKLKKITHIEPWEDSSEAISWTAAMLSKRYFLGDGKRVFPSCIWVVFDKFDTLRIFNLNQKMPKPNDLERIKSLVNDIRNGGGVERAF